MMTIIQTITVYTLIILFCSTVRSMHIQVMKVLIVLQSVFQSSFYALPPVSGQRLWPSTLESITPLHIDLKGAENIIKRHERKPVVKGFIFGKQCDLEGQCFAWLNSTFLFWTRKVALLAAQKVPQCNLKPSRPL